MSSGMNLEQAKAYAKTMSYSEAISNVKYGKSIKYRKATMIKLRELAQIADMLDNKQVMYYSQVDEITPFNKLNNTPAVEPKQGEWIYCEDDEGQDGYRCSECGFFVPWYYGYEDINFIHRYNACPSCMARMKGTDDED